MTNLSRVSSRRRLTRDVLARLFFWQRFAEETMSYLEGKGVDFADPDWAMDDEETTPLPHTHAPYLPTLDSDPYPRPRSPTLEPSPHHGLLRPPPQDPDPCLPPPRPLTPPDPQ